SADPQERQCLNRAERPVRKRAQVLRRQARRLDGQPLPDGQRDIPRLRAGECLLDVFRCGERLTWIEASRYSSRRRITDRMRLRLEVAKKWAQRGQELGDCGVPQASTELASPLKVLSTQRTNKDVVGFLQHGGPHRKRQLLRPLLRRNDPTMPPIQP